MKTKIILAILLSFIFNCSVHADSAIIDVMVNNSYIKLDTESIIMSDTVLTGARAIASALGCDEILWNEKEKKAAFVAGEKEIVITIGESVAQVNGEKIKMPTKAIIINSRTFVPVRFIAETLGATVSWNQKKHTVEIIKEGHQVENENINFDYTADDVEWLAKIVHAEAQGEPMNGKIAVANVILNRVESELFPNSIYNVIFDTKYGVQFTPVANGTIYNNPSNESYLAVKKAFRGVNFAGDSLYFCNPLISTNFWIINNRMFYTRIGLHDFYL